tara:strand:+ start:111 stop:626 length:516 start_codon:yes stop_codon:yes gene_type:complete
VKKNLFFIIFLLLGCSSKSTYIEEISCPKVLFSSEHRNYITSENSEISLNNIAYKANINNYSYDKKCIINDKNILIDLSLLFVVNPEKTKNKEIYLPYYVAFINQNNELFHVEYFKVSGIFKINYDNEQFIETELIDKPNIQLKLENTDLDSINTIMIGFMLDDNKLKILN